MTKDTHTLAKVCRSELIVSCDKTAIETAWKEAVEKTDNGNYFSYTLEAASNGTTRVVLWPFAVYAGGIESSFIDLMMLDLPGADNFVEETFMPFKKKALKKLCVLCIHRHNRLEPLKVTLMMDARAGKEKKILLSKAYDFCKNQFRNAYIAADPRIFAPARIMDELSMSLAEKLC